MQKFDSENFAIDLFLTLFQRQAKKAQVDDNELVTRLLSLFNVEDVELINRESED